MEIINNKSIYIKLLLIVIFMTLFIFMLPQMSYAKKIKSLGSLKAFEAKDFILYDEKININVNDGIVSETYEICNPQDVEREICFELPRDNVAKVSNEGNTLNSAALDNKYSLEVFADDKKIKLYNDFEESNKNNINNNIKINTNTNTNTNNDIPNKFNIKFKPGETKTINVIYKTSWDIKDDYSVYIALNRKDNQSFNERIRHTKITFDFDSLCDYFVIEPYDNSIYKKIDDKYIWEASEYITKEDIILLMRPKLLNNKSIDVSYYKNENLLTGKKILIDISSNYTKTNLEKELVKQAGLELKEKLLGMNAEVILSNEKKKIKKQIKENKKIDYVITLICKSSVDTNISNKVISIEGIEKGKEEKYIKSKKLAFYIINCDIAGMKNIFNNYRMFSNDIDNSLNNNTKTNNNNIITLGDEMVIPEIDFDDVPRVIASLGYITDETQSFYDYDNFLERIKLGLVLNEEKIYRDRIRKSSKSDIQVTKYGLEINNSKLNFIKNFINNIKNKFTKFFGFNFITIALCIFCGIVIGITIFVIVINNIEKKFRKEYEDKINVKKIDKNNKDNNANVKSKNEGLKNKEEKNNKEIIYVSSKYKDNVYLANKDKEKEDKNKEHKNKEHKEKEKTKHIKEVKEIKHKKDEIN